MADRGKQEPLTMEQAMEGLPKEFAFFADRWRTAIS